jgi:hypothetical protein
MWAHKTNLTLPLFIEVSVPSQKSEWSCTCICVLRVSIFLLSSCFLLDFGIVHADSVVCFVFHFIRYIYSLTIGQAK